MPEHIDNQMTDEPKKKLEPVEVPSADDGQRLDRFLTNICKSVSFTDIRRLCRKGQIRLNGSRVKGSETLHTADKLRLPPFMVDEARLGLKVAPTGGTKGKQFASLILFEDDCFVIINKPAGIASQGGSKQKDSLDEWAKAYDSSLKLVHRLDKDTTGCLTFAKGRAMAKELGDVFKSRDMQKIYWAIGAGEMNHEQDLCDRRLKKDGPAGEQRVVVAKDGQDALTKYWRLGVGEGLTWLALHPITGRMHQIRVHMQFMGHPVVGDLKYGGSESAIADITGYGALFLHARQISFPHPVKKDMPVLVDAPAPEHFKVLFKIMDWSE